jgi:hypothetical protein
MTHSGGLEWNADFGLKIDWCPDFGSRKLTTFIFIAGIGYDADLRFD